MARGKFHGLAYRRTCGDGRDRYNLALVRTTTSVITRLSLRDKIRVDRVCALTVCLVYPVIWENYFTRV